MGSAFDRLNVRCDALRSINWMFLLSLAPAPTLRLKLQRSVKLVLIILKALSHALPRKAHPKPGGEAAVICVVAYTSNRQEHPAGKINTVL